MKGVTGFLLIAPLFFFNIFSINGSDEVYVAI